MDLFRYNQLKHIGKCGLKCKYCNRFKNTRNVNKTLIELQERA